MKQFLLTKKMLLQAGNNDDYDFHIDNNGGNVDVIDDDDVDYKELGWVPCMTPTQPSLHIVHDQVSDIGPFDPLLILSELGHNVDKVDSAYEVVRNVVTHEMICHKLHQPGQFTWE